MDNKTTDFKIIFACNKYGILNEIFLDTASLLENIKLPISFHSLVAPISIEELGVFWLSIHANGMAESTVLSLSFNNRQISFIFSGYLLKDSVLICGKTELTSTEKALEEIMLINNEQANQIRLTEKKVGNILNVIENKDINEAFLNDFSSLNNELINNKRELIRKNQKIELLNKELNAVNENMTIFTYSVSHDLKEPVRMIKSFITLFHKKYGDSLDQKGRTYIEMALDGANRLSNMMADLLEYHQSSNLGILTSVDLNEVLQEVKYILQKEIKTKNAEIIIEELPIIKGYSAGFRQIFQNLISNAIKFIPKGKTPIISIRLEELDSHYICMVKDNGIGIPENQKQDVFKLFKRLNSSEEFSGTGMGLAMVKKSIERMGGEVWLESVEGKGTTFYFTIKKNMKLLSYMLSD